MGQEEKSNTRKITIKIEEINQKVLAKEKILKRYRQSKTTKEQFTNKLAEITREDTNNRMQKLNNFGVKYGNQESITKKPNGLRTWQTIEKDSKKDRKLIYSEQL